MEFVPYARRSSKQLKEDKEQLNQFHKTVRHFFERALVDNQVSLAATGPNLDVERKAIDTVVIHHTSHTPGYRLSYMEAVHLLNIYAPYYANPTIVGEESLKGQPVWSNHRRAGRQTFIGYHWLMRMDGSFERLLDDDQIGWHAGNWDINCRSIGVCLDNDYEQSDPGPETLKKLAAHIKRHYPNVASNGIIGHCEARVETICPGTNFIDSWKTKLVELID